MIESANWVATSEFPQEEGWNADVNIDQTQLYDTESTESRDKWKKSGVSIESNGDRIYFGIIILMSCFCYIIATSRFFKGETSSTALYSYWFALGTAFGILALSQFEGLRLFLARVMKKTSFLLFICLFASIIGCCLGGYINNVKLSVISSIFQCVCLILLISLYKPSILFFNTVATPKAKE